MNNERPDARPASARPDAPRTDSSRPDASTPSTSTTPSTRPRPAAQDDDNALESIGKAISSPMEGAAEPEEPRSNGTPPQAPGS